MLAISPSTVTTAIYAQSPGQHEDELSFVVRQLALRQLEVLNLAADVDDGEYGAKSGGDFSTQSLHVEVVVMAIQTWGGEAKRRKKGIERTG